MKQKKVVLLFFIFLFLALPVFCIENKNIYQAYYDKKYDIVLQELLTKGYKNKEFLLINTYFNMGDFKNAQSYLYKYKPKNKLESNYHDFINFLLCLKDENLNYAQELYEKIRKNNIDPYLLRIATNYLGEYYFFANQYEQAEQYFLFITNQHKEDNYDYLANQNLVLIYLSVNNISSAEKQLKNLLLTYPEILQNNAFRKKIENSFNLFVLEKILPDSNDFYQFCQNLYQNKQYAEVIYYLERFIKVFPYDKKNNSAELLLGLSYFQRKNYWQAIILFNKNDSAKAYFYKAQAYEYLADLAKAKQAYQYILDNFSDSNYLSSAAFQIYLLQKSDFSLTDFNDFIDNLKKKNIETKSLNKIYFDYAYYQIRCKSYQLSLEFLDQITFEPNNIPQNAELLYWKGKINELIGQRSIAKKYYDECVTKYPLTFYAFRIASLTNNFPKIRIVSTKIQPLNSYLDLYYNGFADIAIEKLNNLRKAKKQLEFSEIYTLSYLYYLQQDYYSARKNVLRNFDIHTYYEKNKYLPREYLEIIYPLAYKKEVMEYAKLFQLEPALIYGVMCKESNFKITARSRSNAVGLMQILPSTGKGIADKFQELYQGESFLENVNNNIRYGSFYLQSLAKRFNNNYIFILSGYNGGPNRTKAWLEEFKTEDPDLFISMLTYQQTKDYIPGVLENYWLFKNLYFVN